MKEVERPTKNEQSQEIIPPLDFSSLVLPFYTQL